MSILFFAQVDRKIDASLLKKVEVWNKHCGPLPSYRGVYPVFWGMLNEEPHLGTTIYKMDEGFDTGPILSQTLMADKKMTFFQAYHKLYDLSAELLIELCTKGKGRVLPTGLKDSYYSYPRTQNRTKFLERNKFGVPFRFHPSVKPRSSGHRMNET